MVRVQENAGTIPAARTPLPLPPPPDFPGTACSLLLLMHGCRITIVRRDVTAAALAEKSHLSPHPHPCPQGVSLSTKNNPLLCLQCVTPHPAPFHRPTSRFPGTRFICPKNESSQRSALSVSTSPLNF